MKVKFADYEVEIKAKYENNAKTSKQATLGLLNWLAMALRSSAKFQYCLGCNAIGDEMKQAANELHKVCQENGLYND